MRFFLSAVDQALTALASFGFLLGGAMVLNAELQAAVGILIASGVAVTLVHVVFVTMPGAIDAGIGGTDRMLWNRIASVELLVGPLSAAIATVAATALFPLALGAGEIALVAGFFASWAVYDFGRRVAHIDDHLLQSLLCSGLLLFGRLLLLVLVRPADVLTLLGWLVAVQAMAAAFHVCGMLLASSRKFESARLRWSDALTGLWRSGWIAFAYALGWLWSMSPLVLLSIAADSTMVAGYVTLRAITNAFNLALEWFEIRVVRDLAVAHRQSAIRYRIVHSRVLAGFAVAWIAGLVVLLIGAAWLDQSPLAGHDLTRPDLLMAWLLQLVTFAMRLGEAEARISRDDWRCAAGRAACLAFTSLGLVAIWATDLPEGWLIGFSLAACIGGALAALATMKLIWNRRSKAGGGTVPVAAAED